MLCHNSNFDTKLQASPAKRNSLDSKITGRKADASFLEDVQEKASLLLCLKEAQMEILLSTQ